VTATLSPLFSWRSAICDSDLPPTARHVALTLSLHMSERGDSCFPPLTQQQAETGLSRSAVCDNLKLIEEAGYLRREKGAKGRATRYFATAPDSTVGLLPPSPPGLLSSPPGVPEVAREVVKVQEQDLKSIVRRDRVRLVRGEWNVLSPPLIKHRESYLSSPKTASAVEVALRTYPVEDIISAIQSYATVLSGPEYRWDHRWTIIDFLKRGLDRFVPEAQPLDNFLIKAQSAPSSGPNMKYGRRNVTGTEMREIADRLQAERLAEERKQLAPS
jgi:hypothetical protein